MWGRADVISLRLARYCCLVIATTLLASVAFAAKPAGARWVGARVCATCHAVQYQAWQGSQHDLAMQVASSESVLGDFDRAVYNYGDIRSAFFRRDGKFFVNTDGPDGLLADFEILYTFGVSPLQQYLIVLPGGRLQALGIAWDSRPKERGGQRWFHLYPDQKIAAGDPLHWTGIEQNWNYQCADCHSTGVEKRYRAKSQSFDTRWSEINVACEACHGPGGRHVDWAGGGRNKGADKGLVNGRLTGSREVDSCARCHARRGQFADAFRHGPSLADAYRPVTLEPGLYWPDGQIRDEVYEYGAFLQSKMAAAGVTCSNCHEPHSQKLRSPGNALCTSCHLPARFDGPQHHHHNTTGAGSSCAGCHMPAVTYMQVDARPDHSFRLPRPDLTQSLGVPNTCNQCHREQTPAWASERLLQWYGHPPRTYQNFAQAFSAAAGDTLPADELLRELGRIAADAGQPAIVRATALARLADRPSAAAMQIAARHLGERDVMLREAAVNTLAHAAVSVRARLLPPLLSDPARNLRMAAARALAGGPERLLTKAQRTAFRAALDEYEAAQRYNDDRPEARTELGALYADRGDAAAAEREYRAAIALDPSFAYASVNLGELLRGLGREPEAEALLRAALARAPAAAILHHALGMSLVRQKRYDAALMELAEANRLQRDNVRYAYVYAIALHDTGRGTESIAVLRETLVRAPGNVLLQRALRDFNDQPR